MSCRGLIRPPRVLDLGSFICNAHIDGGLKSCIIFKQCQYNVSVVKNGHLNLRHFSKYDLLIISVMHY